MSQSGSSERSYWPLAVLVAIAALGAFALSYRFHNGFSCGMSFFMGLFLCQFAMMKLFRPSDFVQAFQKYDLLAKRFPLYGYFYPMIELALGLSYLAFFFPVATYMITILVMSFGAVGVILALKKGLDLRCACMGTVLNVPLSTVTLVEDLAMGAMACWMLY